MMKARHQYDLGIIGNCSYMSYIDKTANVVWQCWPYFDSSFIFGGLLDNEKGGRFSISPLEEGYSSKQYYKQNTNILVTEFKCRDGKFAVIDFAPRFDLYERHYKPFMLLRKIRRLEGTPTIKVICRPVGNYGEKKAHPHLGSNHISYDGLDENCRLTTNVSLSYIYNERAFALTEDKHLVLTWGDPLDAPLERTFENFYQMTKQYWRKWIERSSIPNMFQAQVIRSALILKLHQFEDTGAIIASGTTSLPEHPGEERNWDYRYCWIRDSYFTLSALNSLGHFNEAEKYSHFIQNIVQNEKGEVFQPVYAIDGSKKLTEERLALSGYQGHGPVRIGNAAYLQEQHDVYGQMLLALLPIYTDLRVYNTNSKPGLNIIHKILDMILKYMDFPDAGIWEYRGKKQKHAESYLFHWAGAQAAIKIAENSYRCELIYDEELMKKANQIIQLAVENLEKCYDVDLQAYGMSQENKKLNASEFLLIVMQYLDLKSDKAKKHLQALEKELKTPNNLIYRYRDIDDFGDTHSTFLICSFWYVESLVSLGEVEKAIEIFEDLIQRSNSLGIYSEDICPEDGSQWGNIAQTYSHVGLINAAFKIARNLNWPHFL